MQVDVENQVFFGLGSPLAVFCRTRNPEPVPSDPRDAVLNYGRPGKEFLRVGSAILYANYLSNIGQYC